MITGFIDAAISRTRTTLLMMAVVVLCGLIARAILPIANEPHIELPYFYIGIVHEGISPEDGERLLIQPVEIEIQKLEGVEEVTALASEGSVSVFVEFDATYDLDQAMLDVREAVDRAKAELPATAEEPFVEELTAESFPVMQLSLIGRGISERTVYLTALALQTEIEGIPSVLSADLLGQREELLEIVIDPVALETYRITSEELINTLSRNNRLIPAGSIDTGAGRFPVKVPSVIETREDVLDLPIRASGDTVVTLGDVATIRRTFKDRTSHARVNGLEAISIRIEKRADANVIDTVDAVRSLVDAARPRLPAGVDIMLTLDQAEFARLQVTELQGNIVTALALVMVVVVAAMGFRSGVIVGLAIPVSLLFSVIIIYLLGYTFNFMVMFGMLLGLGMLIDGAIVVTEYADRLMGEGLDHRRAYSEAVKRMFWPVTASTATTLAAFVPMIFWPGIPGQFMRYLPVTVFTVLCGSLLYALLFGPVLGTLFGKPTAHSAGEARKLALLESGDPTDLDSPTGWYARLVRKVVYRPLTTIGIIGLLLLAIFVTYGRYNSGMVFFSDSDPQFLEVAVRARGNFSADDANQLVWQAERELLQISGIRSTNSNASAGGGGGSGGLGRSNGASSDTVGSIFVELQPEYARKRSGREIIREIRERTTGFPGIQVDIMPMEQGPQEGKPIEIEFASRERGRLQPVVEEVRRFMDALPGLVDIDDTLPLPNIEWRLKVDRAKAALYGADVLSAGVAVQLVTNGVKVDEYRPDGADEAVDIRVRYPEDSRGILAMDRLRVATAQGMVPLSHFVKLESGRAVDTLRRVNGVPVHRIRADVEDGVLVDAKVREISAWLARQNLDPAVEIRFRGTREEQDESMAFVQVAFMLSLLLMFLLLVTQFNSFYQSGLILLAVTMSTAGVLLGLLVTSSPFSAILSGVGVVALAGIVVNNNIVLIDTFNVVRARLPDVDLRDVIVRASAQRLRPVMLTTVTTVLGLLPLACSLSVDLINRQITASGQMAVFWGPLSQAIVFGLSFATILTLIATPAMLALPGALRRLAPDLRRSPDQLEAAS